ncbi:MAG: CPBP family intramembrane metalloprotease [Treponema sp.]|nr:CPBP family intramembrane metalloprotease [Treponema sp.]
MKKNFLFYLLFFSVLLFFVIPPIGAPFFVERQEAFVAHYPVSVFLNASIAFLIYYFSQKRAVLFSEMPLCSEKKPFFVYLSAASVSFGLLCLSSVVFEILSVVMGSESGIHQVLFPSGALGMVNFILGVCAAAFFEEVIYRFFLPSAFLEILTRRLLRKSVSRTDDKSAENRKLWIFCEGISGLLFAAGHLYLGVFGFLNALVCGIALRVCMIRTQSIWISCAVHALYNFLTIVLFSLMS